MDGFITSFSSDLSSTNWKYGATINISSFSFRSLRSSWSKITTPDITGIFNSIAVKMPRVIQFKTKCNFNITKSPSQSYSGSIVFSLNPNITSMDVVSLNLLTMSTPFSTSASNTIFIDTMGDHYSNDLSIGLYPSMGSDLYIVKDGYAKFRASLYANGSELSSGEFQATVSNFKIEVYYL